MNGYDGLRREDTPMVRIDFLNGAWWVVESLHHSLGETRRGPIDDLETAERLRVECERRMLSVLAGAVAEITARMDAAPQGPKHVTVSLTGNGMDALKSIGVRQLEEYVKRHDRLPR